MSDSHYLGANAPLSKRQERLNAIPTCELRKLPFAKLVELVDGDNPHSDSYQWYQFEHRGRCYRATPNQRGGGFALRKSQWEEV